MSNCCMVSELQRFPFLRKRMDEIVGNFLQEVLEPTETLIGHIVEMEVYLKQERTFTLSLVTSGSDFNLLCTHGSLKYFLLAPQKFVT
ncbi:hypothetical protein LguiA_029026 [Lonicera macranthoides]